MLKNYFKITFRSLLANKVTAFINVAGLSIGMAAATLILLWIQNEYSYDQFHVNKKELYKVWNRSAEDIKGPVDCWPAIAPPVGPVLKQQYPQIAATTRVDVPVDRLIDYADKELTVNSIGADKSFLTMFSFPLLQGNAANALDDVNNVLLTETTAKRLFGDIDPMNRIVKLDNNKSYKVTGILKDLPGNTEFQFDCLIPLTGVNDFSASAWRDHQFLTYVQLKPGTSFDSFNKTIKKIVLDHAPAAGVELFLQPASEWHLYSRFEDGKIAGGLIDTVRLLFIIACFILFIACINFMNLGTAQSEKRAKEVGVRKVMGATKSALVKQFLAESIFVTAIAGLLALLLVQICLPAFNQLVGENLIIDYTNPIFWATAVGFILITGILAGSYPAFFLSSFRPVSVLKSLFKGRDRSLSPRKILIVAQFTIAIVLIISTLVIFQQLQYIRHRDIGYNKNNLAELRMTPEVERNYTLIKSSLLNSGAASMVCETGLPITMDNGDQRGYQWGNLSERQKDTRFNLFATSGNFVKTMDLKLISGRDIDFHEYPADSASVLINQTAVKIMGLNDPVGQVIKNGSTNLTIVGVINDFINGSPDQRIGPMIILGSKSWHWNIAFRLNTQKSIPADLHMAQAIFKKYNPSYIFKYNFVDEEYNNKFSDQLKSEKLAGIAAILTIVISCLGLFGLSAFMAENRAREIGIRKVLGASVNSLIRLFTGEFVLLVIIAIIIGVPVGWWLMNAWLHDATYRIDVSWLTFVLAGSLAIFIAIFTVSFQAVKAALSNPVKSLRSN